VKLPRVRFTMRRMMIAVALAASALGAARIAGRVTYYREMAVHHSKRENACRSLLDGGSLVLFRSDGRIRVALTNEKLADGTARAFGGELAPTTFLASADPSPDPRINRFTVRDRIGYHARMREKYERGVSSPWIAVAPDPPEPE
jgi:hypothetical protein